MSKDNDIDIIKQILLKLFVINGESVIIDPFLILDKELIKLLKELKGV